MQNKSIFFWKLEGGFESFAGCGPAKKVKVKSKQRSAQMPQDFGINPLVSQKTLTQSVWQRNK